MKIKKSIKKTIHLFGNHLLPFDRLPLELRPDLERLFPNFNFVEIDPTENLHPKNKELIIIDTVANTNDVKVLKDIEKIQVEKIYSQHDFDLGFNLKLLQKLGELEKLTVFCLPMKIDKKVALRELKKKIKKEML